MRVLIVNTSERTGGAAIAAGRLMKALRDNGIKANMLVRDKQTDHISVIGLKKSWWKLWQFIWERVVILKANNFKRHNLFLVDIANTGTDITKLPEFKQADVIHLHWINQGMLSLKDIDKIIATNKPIVWTMHDMWPFTGICHYAGECTNYETHCHDCHLLLGKGKKDLSYRTFNRKEKLFDGARIVFVSCSNWLGEIAKRSALIKDKHILSIPNAIDTNLFKPISKSDVRKKYKLPLDKKLILFGSLKISDKRKGFDYLAEACKLLKEKDKELNDNLGIVIFGKESEHYANLLPFKIYPMNYINSEKELAEVYNAVDIYVTPSLSDNLPNTIMEAMACGIPCVGFNVGGIPEMITHLKNGYVAEFKSSDDLAKGIQWTLNENNYATLSEEAHKKVSLSYSESIVAMKYINVYNKVSGKHA